MVSILNNLHVVLVTQENLPMRLDFGSVLIALEVDISQVTLRIPVCSVLQGDMVQQKG